MLSVRGMYECLTLHSTHDNLKARAVNFKIFKLFLKDITRIIFDVKIQRNVKILKNIDNVFLNRIDPMFKIQSFVRYEISNISKSM